MVYASNSVTILYIIFQIFSALLITDFFSGVLHWIQDRYLRRHWPIVGAIIVAPSDLHHSNPRSFTQDGFIHRNWSSFVVASFLAGIFYFSGTLNWFTGSIIATSSVLTQAHYYAHCSPKENGKFIVFLQTIGLLQSPQHHWRHHQGDKDTYFCAMTNYVNPMLEAVQFFQKMELVIQKLTGVRPQAAG